MGSYTEKNEKNIQCQQKTMMLLYLLQKNLLDDWLNKVSNQPSLFRMAQLARRNLRKWII